MNFFFIRSAWMVNMVIFLFFGQGSAQNHFDLVIKKVQIYDGTGGPPVVGDVAVKGDKISAVGKLKNYQARKIIKGRALTLCPGFIDLHSHADDPLLAAVSLRAPIPALRMAHNLVMQGVTTAVVNQDGRSPWSIRAQREQLERQGFGPNVILMVGHNTIRSLAMGHDYRREATPAEIQRMQESLMEGLAAGAFGLTAGLEYVPGRWSHPDELIALAEAMTAAGGVYIVHERASGADPMWYWPSMREPAPGSMLDNLREVIALTAQTAIPACITHIKARGIDFWGKSAEMIALIDSARAAQLELWADQYPYTLSGSDMQTVLLPPWAYDLAHHASENDLLPLTYAQLLKKILTDGDQKAALIKDVRHEIERRGGADQIFVQDFTQPRFEKKSLKEVAQSLGLSGEETVFWMQEHGFPDRPGGVSLIAYSLNENDVQNFMRQPWCITASDGGLALPEESTAVHARFYGTFPRKIAYYARDQKVIPVSQAIHSCTGMPAQFLGLTNRGLIKAGYQADLVLMDLEKLADQATIEQPQRYPQGIIQVWVNGQAVVKQGKLVQAYPGKIIEHVESLRFKTKKR